MVQSSVRKFALGFAAVCVLGAGASTAQAAQYKIDPAHSFIQFRVQHLGYSWLIGSFNDLGGSFSYDPASPADSRIDVEINAASVDSNHVKRDKHLRSEDFLEVDKFPTATFKSTGFEGDANGGTLSGELTLHGVSRPISFDVKKIGEGDDPWGGYRAGFQGAMSMTRSDFGIDYNLGPASELVELELFVEGIRE